MKEINKRDIALIISIILIILIVTIIMVIPKNNIETNNNLGNNITNSNEDNILNLPFVEMPHNWVDENGQEVRPPINATGIIVNTTLQ